MNLKAPREHWQDHCNVAPDIRERHGLSAALGYVVGEKLMMFAQTAETDDRFRAELPSFCKKTRQLFSRRSSSDISIPRKEIHSSNLTYSKGQPLKKLKSYEKSLTPRSRIASDARGSRQC